MNQDGSIALFQYWNRLRGGRPAPKRTEIEPAEIKSQLADTFILERDARGEPVFRLAGTRLCAIYGRELKGFSFPSLWAADDQQMIGRVTRDAFQEKAVVAVTFHGLSLSGRTNPFELLILPLDGGIENPRALGSLLPALKPFWLGADPIVENQIETLRLIDPNEQPAPMRRGATVKAPPLAPSHGAILDEVGETEGGRRIRHLVVFDGGRSR